ncbi:hypothetical protein jaqu_10290 [Jannaschia aquimarina]|uniref:Host specificity protein n=1 Tax=Jannaschia aquimarina TaxID=935700 RepID=A0A0D1DBH4_9RHOB|nr:glycoside hydrolase TIM-barrel-like domain-containing protein [Jannaschia aquimarina]KIT17298.1 hypothetical protein jaqu_10290 [Jannaschia aquimarina]SNT19862.1 Putative phage tail protein [Jannaschia aquimarina]
MATLVLGALGATIGGSIGGSVLGLSGAVIGRAIGATVGRAIDQRVLGGGAEVVETGRIDRFRLSTASEGNPIPRIVGRMRVAGQVIWSTPFEETVNTSGGGGGKGGPSQPQVKEYSYSVSLAIALCEGEILRIGRVWADGRELALDEVPFRLYRGSEDQLPDALIEAVEGERNAPAYRGVAYVVIEDLQLGPFGNRVPQFNFEVVRTSRAAGEVPAPQDLVQGVAMMPGTGEFALSTERVDYAASGLTTRSANVHSAAEVPDLQLSLRNLREEAPQVKSSSLIVSWFGSDLRVGECELKPKVEQSGEDGVQFPWKVSNLTRSTAEILAQQGNGAVYGGTPSDLSVMQAIAAMNDDGMDVTFYPFILMEQLAGNNLPDPYGAAEQPVLPWRGRITTSVAPGFEGSPDRSEAASQEVAQFFGAAAASDFALDYDRPDFGDGSAGAIIRAIVASDGQLRSIPKIVYSGPEEWSYRRFILHQASLCAAAGGVEAFCIGSEMRGLTQIRGTGDTFPAVDQLRDLAAEVKKILPDAKIGYAADWSEYFGYHPQDGSGDVFFHLDPLWADPNIDFVGIDNYMPLSDWRDGKSHLDQSWGSGHDIGYLQANIEGGEGYDWFYGSPEARDGQRRTPIVDDAHGEDWVFRYKDIRNWWGSYHHERRGGGVRIPEPTGWEPGLKPIRFTEYGCAAIDKGANQPNVFLDPKSSESFLPHYSNGLRDDAMQMQYIRALTTYWQRADRNPVFELYGKEMLDLSHSFLWAWDARPWPTFPNDQETWSDGENYLTGHWWSGRSASLPLSTVIAEICIAAGISRFDVSGVRGIVRGYAMNDVQTARADLQPLLFAYGVEAAEIGGELRFYMRADANDIVVPGEKLVREGETPILEEVRSPDPEIVGQVRVHHIESDGRFDLRVGEAGQLVRSGFVQVTDTELPVSLTAAEGIAIAERYLAESRLGRETISLRLPPSWRNVAAGDHLVIEGLEGRWRVDRLEEGSARRIDATRTDPSVFHPSRPASDLSRVKPYRAGAPLAPIFMDLPLLTGSESPHAPHLAVAARPWPGSVAALSSAEEAGYISDTIVRAPAMLGVSETLLVPAAPGVWDRGPALRVRFGSGQLSRRSEAALLAGANVAAIGLGFRPGLGDFPVPGGGSNRSRSVGAFDAPARTERNGAFGPKGWLAYWQPRDDPRWDGGTSKCRAGHGGAAAQLCNRAGAVRDRPSRLQADPNHAPGCRTPSLRTRSPSDDARRRCP